MQFSLQHNDTPRSTSSTEVAMAVSPPASCHSSPFNRATSHVGNVSPTFCHHLKSVPKDKRGAQPQSQAFAPRSAPPSSRSLSPPQKPPLSANLRRAASWKSGLLARQSFMPITHPRIRRYLVEPPSARCTRFFTVTGFAL
jgi:hypothetical protein